MPLQDLLRSELRFLQNCLLFSLSSCGQVFLQQHSFSIPTGMSNGAIDGSQSADSRATVMRIDWRATCCVLS